MAVQGLDPLSRNTFLPNFMLADERVAPPGERDADQVAAAIQNFAPMSLNEATNQLYVSFQNFGFVAFRRGSVVALGASNVTTAFRSFLKGNISDGLWYSGLAIASGILYQTDVMLSVQSEANIALRENNAEYARNNEVLSESISQLQALFGSFTNVATDRAKTETQIRSVLGRLETLQTQQASTLAGQIQQFFSGTQGKNLLEIHTQLEAVNQALQATKDQIQASAEAMQQQVNALIEENGQRHTLLGQFHSLRDLAPSLFNIAENSEVFRQLPQREQEAIVRLRIAYEHLVGAHP